MRTPTPILGPRAPTPRLKRTLDGFLATVDRPALVRADPVELVRGYSDPHDQEVAGLLVAMIAYGRVAAIKAKASQILTALGPSPARGVDGGRRDRRLDGVVYRFQKQDDFPRFVRAIRRVRRVHGSLGAAFGAAVRAADAAGGGPTYADAMARFVAELRAAAGGPPSYGLRFLLPDPATGGAAKRLCLYLRWMIRPDDGLDPGSWRALADGLEPARLIMPIDTHVARIARYLGLTDRKANDLVTAIEITDALRDLAADDPLRYDMALCHLGISGQCPARRDPVRCAGCPIQTVCRLGPEPARWPPA